MQLFGGSENTQSLPAPIAFGNNAFKMYVFNRNGVCTLYKEWNRLSHSRIFHQDQNGKLVFGLLFSLKSLTAKMDPTRCVSAASKNLNLFCS